MAWSEFPVLARCGLRRPWSTSCERAWDLPSSWTCSCGHAGACAPGGRRQTHFNARRSSAFPALCNGSATTT